MRYIAEVAIDAGNLARELSQMRMWLDHMKFQAVGFRQIPGANIYRVDFEREQEARAFAQAFAGRVRNRAAVSAMGYRHPRESGGPEPAPGLNRGADAAVLEHLDSRFGGNDDQAR